MKLSHPASNYTATLKHIVAHGIELSEVEVEAIRKAFASRGRYQGWLQRNKPSRSVMGGMAAAAWLALQPNHYKASVFAVMSLTMLHADEPEAILYNKLADLPKLPIDLDRAQLTACGVW